MEPPQARHKAISEEKRERDVFLLYGAAIRDIPILDELVQESDSYSLPDHHVAQASSDSTLTALAQLATFRLQADRCMISLIDDHRQYILAEATPDLALSSVNTPSNLWLGRISIPKSRSVCQEVLNIDVRETQQDRLRTLVIKDFRDDPGQLYHSFARAKDARFYAGVPLLSPAGAIVGSLFVLGSQPRPEGLSEVHEKSLHDVAHSVMEYLRTYTIQEQYRRAESFNRGLISFSEGANQVFFEDSRGHSPEARSPDPSGASSYSQFFDKNEGEAVSGQQQQPRHPTSFPTRPKPNRQRSIKELQEDILPLDSRSMFRRAANVMMASSDLDGVLILDASVAANKRRYRRNSDGTSETSSTEAETSSPSKTHSSDEDLEGGSQSGHTRGSSACQILGYATREDDLNQLHREQPPYDSLSEMDLARLLNDFPHGKVMIFDGDGLSLSSTDEGPTSSGTSDAAAEIPKRKSFIGRTRKHSLAIRAVLPEARSVAFIPFWDYERSRWFAGCLCWSNSPYRLLSTSSDLARFKVFSHSIMRELSRLDAVVLGQAKTTFVSSISHEMRSPLHGILGTLEFLKDTPMDSFQSSMFNSLNACAQTLLDTINHVMDHAEISELQRNTSSRLVKNPRTVRISSKPLKGRRSRASAFDFGIATEEVVEAIFAGSSYMPMAGVMADEPTSPLQPELDRLAKRKHCYIVLDIGREDDWAYSFPIGSWRRIVMNIIGNAIKYTESGHIQVSLRTSDASKATDMSTTVTLTVTDTGRGISPQFLADKAFQPFAQENSFAPGTGLGLSIIKQIIEMNGGKVEISSEPSRGTQLTVKLALSRPETAIANSPRLIQYLSQLPRLKGRRVCILSKDVVSLQEGSGTSLSREGLQRFTSSLANTLVNNLKMDVVQTTKWEGHDSELVIVPEVSFEYLAAIRRSRIKHGRAPVTIFVAMDGLEAATLRSDARVRRKESVVEVMTQPCGPCKLAQILNRCLDLYALPEENLPRQSSGTQSPQPALLGFIRQHNPVFTSSSPAITEEVMPEYSPLETPILELPEPDFNTTLPTIPQPQVPPSTKVLIVDDNSINRSILVAFLKRHKYDYQEAHNGLEAFETYRRSPHSFRAILMDMSMPVMDGMTSTRAIRQHEKSIGIAPCCIIALTGLASASARLEALNAGVDSFLTKPVNFKELAELMQMGWARRKMSRTLSDDSVKKKRLEVRMDEVAERGESVEKGGEGSVGTLASSMVDVGNADEVKHEVS